MSVIKKIDWTQLDINDNDNKNPLSGLDAFLLIYISIFLT
jgi:hypothetical protein